jgi:hypothetical protein
MRAQRSTTRCHTEPLIHGRGQRHRGANATAQARPHARSGAQHPAGNRKGSQAESPDVMFGAGFADAYGHSRWKQRR